MAAGARSAHRARAGQREALLTGAASRDDARMKVTKLSDDDRRAQTRAAQRTGPSSAASSTGEFKFADFVRGVRLHDELCARRRAHEPPPRVVRTSGTRSWSTSRRTTPPASARSTSSSPRPDGQAGYASRVALIVEHGERDRHRLLGARDHRLVGLDLLVRAQHLLLVARVLVLERLDLARAARRSAGRARRSRRRAARSSALRSAMVCTADGELALDALDACRAPTTGRGGARRARRSSSPAIARVLGGELAARCSACSACLRGERALRARRRRPPSA